MDLQKLKIELATDPAGLVYNGKTPQQKADLLNSLTTNRTRPRGVVETWRIFERFNEAEYLARTIDATNAVRNRSLLETLLGMGTVNVNSPNISAIITTVFGVSAQTTRNLIGSAQADAVWVGSDLRIVKISRAEEIGLPFVTPQNVKDAEAA